MAEETPQLFEAMRQLVGLQEFDLEIADLDAELAGIPSERSAIASAIDAARLGIEELGQKLEEEELAERRLEGEMRDREALVERLDAQTGQVVTAQAYKALQSEIDHASAARSELETRALELMETINGLQTMLADEKSRLADLEAKAPEQLGEIQARESSFEAARAALLSRRAAACEGIPRDVVTRYDLIAAKRSPATLILEGGSCPSCRMAVPAQRAIEIHRGELMYTCASCRRLLLAAEAFEADSGS